MNNFDDAFNELIGTEGGYINHPNDPGGETKFGITKTVAIANGYVGNMIDLPLTIAKSIAKKCYWDKYHCDEFDIRIAFQLFDIAYNGGKAIEWLQSSAEVVVDGIIGKSTIEAVKQSDPLRIILKLNSYRLSYYTSLKIWPTFGKGWSNRVAKNLLLAAA